MKIGIEGQRLYRTKKFGMDIVALELIKYLQKIDKVNEYIIFVKPDKDNTCIPQSPNFKVVEISTKLFIIWEQLSLPSIAYKMGCDVLHCTSNTAPIFCKVPIITTLHDVIFMEQSILTNNTATWYQKFGNLYRKWITPAVAKNSKKIVTVSNYSKSEILRFFDIPHKMSVIYNGVNESFCKIKDEILLNEVKSLYALPDHFVLFMGNSDPRKNSINVLKAFGKFIKQVELPYKLVITNIPLSTINKTLVEIENANLIEHIIITDYLPFEKLPAVINLCDIFLFPSLNEGFGIPVIEAMACGVPVVTSNITSLPEIAGSAALVINPYQFEEITLAMITIDQNTIQRKELIKSGFIQAKQFSWDKTAQEYHKIYQTFNI